MQASTTVYIGRYLIPQIIGLGLVLPDYLFICHVLINTFIVTDG
jgi:hypothetical protein